MRYVTLTRKEYNQFRAVQVKYRWDWPATFSCNQYHEVWPTSGFGFTRKKDRRYLSRREYPTLHKIVDAYLAARPEGGRFHVNAVGASMAKGGPRICRFKFTR